ncbi:MAG TPA: hypothetical protein PLY73_11130, partial [Candidatus Ozemobacteraceae bacterium]|nr:hypothetical protein [Candidatus Ozemobacteraceae bacterium]
FRSEVMSRPFKELSEQNPSNSETFVKMEGGYPETIDKVMEIQTKYKDFKLEPEIRFTTPNKTILEFRGVVKWTNSEGIARQEEIIFLAVKP